MSAPLLQVRGLTVDYATPQGATRAVDGVSFDLGAGEVMGLAGESGSGKSTLAFAIARLHRPPAHVTGGSVTLADTDVLALTPKELRQWRWREVSVVLQSAMNALNPVLRLSDQFRDMFRAHGITNRAEVAERSAGLLRLVGISPDRLRDYPHQFSGGMRQRLVIALALALKPKLVIMDEPTTALDVVVQREILEQVADLRRRLGFSVLFITHDLALMSQFCDRVGVMLQGRLVELTTPAAIAAGEGKEGANHPYTRRLWDSIPPLHPAQPVRAQPDLVMP
ncbi:MULTISPECIES: ABC transporter ATP-binding protein [Nitrospirillum]|uniref:Peptide/nickel transport system ATP-binding protein n=1 Tax=Nitrospirillum amazonense TaxID=28077 RepID=A0A560FHK3_9PROT|nr:ABC transporter ATP-binding protein [Nitrospirillum amazonense]MEC4590538.1 ABC transporter ATP-binding protein [Nitrospirillum amazonense]TWB21092.1 peptide/nickel transport system ATP-binding protein [Nitrospirillum amazonense]